MQVVDIQRVYFRQTPTKVEPVRGFYGSRGHDRGCSARPAIRSFFSGDRIAPEPCRGFRFFPVMSRLGYLRGAMASFLRRRLVSVATLETSADKRAGHSSDEPVRLRPPQLFLRGFSRGWKHLPAVLFVVAAAGLGGRIFWAALDLAGGVR